MMMEKYRAERKVPENLNKLHTGSHHVVSCNDGGRQDAKKVNNKAPVKGQLNI